MIDEKMFKLLLKSKNKLSEEDYQNIYELIECNEHGIAFEILCTQLSEYEVEISESFYEELASYGQSIQINPFYWLMLKELIKEDQDRNND